MVREKCKNMTLKTALHVNPANISELIAQADIAIGAAGSSAWERCCLGLPTLNLVLADNQQFVNDRLVETGAAFQLTKSKNSQKTALAGDIRRIVFDDNLRVSLQSRAASICDGLGVGRATLLLDPLDVEQDTTLMSRPATEADTEQLFIWQCEPGARRFSRNPNPPSRAEHNGWMESRLLKREGVFEILHTADAAVGMLRLESIEGFTNTLEVSILVASEQQGQSYGRAALEIARRLLPEAIFHASIHNNNIASLKIFNSAGYKVKEDIFICEPRIES
jgi:UDP-2,4-diacetamido-2,4,6-trideoxy-beta-L-altropyranose hydrolase